MTPRDSERKTATTNSPAVTDGTNLVTKGYRPHLDGVRALAVILVVAFHLGYRWIPGGFVGVDVFFVLSGYLITGILADEVSTHRRVRLRRFFARRVRRLLPASLAVLTVVLLLGHRWLNALQFRDVSIDGLWASLYAANWRFASQGGDYFAPGDVPSPLVHYWSLAVEEQFYLIWPVLVAAIAAVCRRRNRSVLGPLLAATVALGGLSMVASVVTAGSPVAYYGTHTRAYQLLAGGALALAVRRFPVLDRSHRELSTRMRHLPGLLAVVSTAVLLWLSNQIASAGNYPGFNGLWVTGASLGLIAALDLSPRGVHQRVFASWPMAALGRWSYSVYIWHWPVIVLAPVAAKRFTETWVDEIPAMVLMIVVLAGISYLLVERPVRFRLLPRSRPLAVVAVGLCCSMLMAFTANANSTISQSDQRALAATKDHQPITPCPQSRKQWAKAPQKPCVWRKGSGPTVALVGDSHAHRLFPAIKALAEANDFTLLLATRMGCPVPDVTYFIDDTQGREFVDRGCTTWRRKVYPQIAEQADVVVVATRSHVFGVLDGQERVQPTDPKHLGLWRWLGLEPRHLGSHGAPVAIASALPTMPQDVPACLMEKGFGANGCDFALASDQTLARYNSTLRSIAATRDNVGFGDLLPLICPGGTCPAVIDGVIVRSDDNHLTATFVRSHRAEIVEAFRRGGVDIANPPR